MERLRKHVSAEKNSYNNRRAVFSVQSVPMGYKKEKEDRLSQLTFETPAFQSMSLEMGELLSRN
jgi:hypothetical protein